MRHSFTLAVARRSGAALSVALLSGGLLSAAQAAAPETAPQPLPQASAPAAAPEAAPQPLPQSASRAAPLPMPATRQDHAPGAISSAMQPLAKPGHHAAAGQAPQPVPALRNAGAADAPADAAPVVLAQTSSGIDAPDTVDPGADVTVKVPGARSGDRLELWGPITQSGSGGQLGSAALTSGTVTFKAPGTPASYRLRHVSNGGRLISQATLDVAAVPVTLSVPGLLGAGIDTEIHWHGPAKPGDKIQIVAPNGTVAAEGPASGTAGGDNITTLMMPKQLGKYTLRYVDGSNGAVLRALPVNIVKGKAWLRSPVEVYVNDPFSVQWSGPVTPDHAFQIIDPASQTVVASRPGAPSQNMKAPSRAGDYRIRYIDTANNIIRAEVPLQVDAR